MRWINVGPENKESQFYIGCVLEFARIRGDCMGDEGIFYDDHWEVIRWSMVIGIDLMLDYHSEFISNKN